MKPISKQAIEYADKAREYASRARYFADRALAEGWTHEADF